MKMTQADHDILDQCLEAVLTACKEDRITVKDGRAMLAEGFCLIANGNANFSRHFRAVIEDLKGDA